MTIIPRFCLISNITGNIFINFDVLSVFLVEFTIFSKGGRGRGFLCKFFDCYLGGFWGLRLNGRGIIFECLGGFRGAGAGPPGRRTPPREGKMYRKVEEGSHKRGGDWG
jgi:hypothetical protein